MNDFEFIDAEKAHFPVAALCEVLDVSRAGFYAWSERPVSPRRQRDVELGAKVADIHARSRKAYGSPRVHDELRDEGERVSRKRVARLMREQGLKGKRRRRFRVTTNSDHTRPVAVNVLARNFSTDAPNRAWVGDITYIWTREGWLYLATLLDLFSRRVVGWAMSDRMKTDLPLSALTMALRARRPAPGLVHHTDRGCQYASETYRRVLDQRGLVASMSRRGNCWDNAVAESFFATLKVELVRDADFATREDARRAVFEYIEVFYNRQRRHSSLGYATPSGVEFDLSLSRKQHRQSVYETGSTPPSCVRAGDGGRRTSRECGSLSRTDTQPGGRSCDHARISPNWNRHYVRVITTQSGSGRTDGTRRACAAMGDHRRPTDRFEFAQVEEAAIL